MTTTFICEKCGNTTFDQMTYTQARCLQCNYLNLHDSGFKGQREFQLSPNKDFLNVDENTNSKAAPLIKRFVTFLIDIIFLSLAFAIGSSIANIEINYQAIMIDTKFSLILTGFMVVYYTISEFFFGKTIGKIFTKTRVISLDGNKLSFIQSLLRGLSRFIPFEFASFIIFLIQGKSLFLHDFIAKTLVVED